MSTPIELHTSSDSDVAMEMRAGPRWPHHPALATPRFVFRPLGVADLQDLMDMAREPRRMDATIGVPQPYDSDFVRTWMATCDPPSAAGRTLHWGTRTLDDDQLVGYTALARIDLQRSQAELRLWVGRGIDRDACAIEWARRVLTFAIDSLHIQRIYSLQLLRYPLGERILTGIGMQYDGIVRKRLSRHAQVEDAICWSISADQWQAFRTR